MTQLRLYYCTTTVLLLYYYYTTAVSLATILLYHYQEPRPPNKFDPRPPNKSKSSVPKNPQTFPDSRFGGAEGGINQEVMLGWECTVLGSSGNQMLEHLRTQAQSVQQWCDCRLAKAAGDGHSDQCAEPQQILQLRYLVSTQ